MSGKIRIAQGGRKFAGVLPGPSGPLGKVGMYNGFYMRNIMDSLPLFSAPLLTSLILAVGIGNPTFTRASTATVTDFEGVVRTAVAGEARFTGARRVQNLLQNTGFLLGGDPPTGWARIAALGIHTITPSLSDATHNQINFSIDNAREIMSYVVNLVAGHSYTLSCYCEAKTEIVALSDTSLFLVQTTAVFTGTPSVATRLFVPGKRVNGTALTCTTSGQATFRLGLGCGANEPGKGSISLSHPQIEDITGATNQNAGDYVSQGVLAAPFQGAGVDGVQYFNNSNGNTVPVFPLLVPGSGTPIPPATLLGYLPEGQRTNLILQCSDYTDAAWTATSVDTTPTANTTAAPDGTLTADTLTEGVAGTAASTQNVVGTANANYSVSRFVKRGNTDWMFMAVFNGANVVRAWFNLATGVKGTLAAGGTGATVASRMDALANGWYRCSVIGSVGSAAVNISFATASAAADNTVVRVNGATRFEWGAQFEDNSSLISALIPTLAGIVTRNEDVLTYSSIGNVLNEQGTLYFEATQNTPAAFNGSIVAVSDTTLNNRVNGFRGGVTAAYRVTSGGVGGVAAAGSNPMTVGLYKLAFRWALNDFKAYLNGLVDLIDTSLNTPIGMTTIYIGISENGGTGVAGFCNIRNVQIYGQPATDSSLQSLTT